MVDQLVMGEALGALRSNGRRKSIEYQRHEAQRNANPSAPLIRASANGSEAGATAYLHQCSPRPPGKGTGNPQTLPPIRPRRRLLRPSDSGLEKRASALIR